MISHVFTTTGNNYLHLLFRHGLVQYHESIIMIVFIQFINVVFCFLFFYFLIYFFCSWKNFIMSQREVKQT